jgi:hypothetical protein
MKNESKSSFFDPKIATFLAFFGIESALSLSETV